jgi:hypothetical protein
MEASAAGDSAIPSTPRSATSSSTRRSNSLVPADSDLRILDFATALGSVGLAAGGVASPLLASELTGGSALAGVPLGVVVIGSAVGALAISRASRTSGRIAKPPLGLPLRRRGQCSRRCRLREEHGANGAAPSCNRSKISRCVACQKHGGVRSSERETSAEDDGQRSHCSATFPPRRPCLPRSLSPRG